MNRICSLLLVLALSGPALASTSPMSTPEPTGTPMGNRVVTIAVSQTFINELIATHLKSEMVQEMKVELEPDKDWIIISGVTRIPVEEMRAINLEPSLGKFHFHLVAKLATTSQGYLILEFPLNETYFYPVGSKDPTHDRVIVPVQMLSIGLASIRGYLAALSGDFGGFDRRTQKLQALIRALDHTIANEKNTDAKEDLKTERESLKLQLAAVPLERKQLEAAAKQFSAMLGFTGEKELNLNDELAAHRNALILKIKLSKMTPYLTGVNLGAIRVWQDKKSTAKESYFAFDVNAELDEPEPVVPKQKYDRPKDATAPAVMVRLKQALFKTKSIVSAEKAQMPSQLRDLDMEFQDDGLHVTGGWKTFLFFKVGFDITVDFTSTAIDQFEIRVRESKVAGINFQFVRGYILQTLRRRLEDAMKGVFTFIEIGNEHDGSQALQVNVDPKKLIPAFPGLHLVGVDVRPREFVLKVGKQ